MKRPTPKKLTPATAAKKRMIGRPKVKTDKAKANQQHAQMPEYLLEEHPELMLDEAFRSS